MKKELVFLVLFLSCLSFVSAHQPRLVYDRLSSAENPFAVNNPEISQAFYGMLKGQPDYYMISETDGFELYLQILAPDVSNARTDFIAEIIFNGETIVLKKNESWDKFYEEFAGDNYLEGSEINFSAGPGKYIIKVSNTGNEGKYVLVVGKIESFPFNEIIKTYINLPRLKMYFEKSPLTAYFNLISIPLWILLALIILSIAVIIRIKKKSKSRKRR
jgi:hypothetical protein